MSIYFYKGRDKNGRPRKGWTEADSPKSARAQLSAAGVMTESIEQAKPDGKVTAESRAKFYNELGVLLSAGFTIEQAFGLLIGEAAGGDDTGFLLSLRDLVRNGSALSEAMGLLVPGLPPFEATALKTSEEAGLQGQMLTTLSTFIENERQVTDKIKAALMYPLTVLALATGLLALMVYVVLPRAIGVFSKIGDALPKSALLLAIWGPRCMTAFIVVAALAVIAFFALRARAKTNAATAVALEKTLVALPVARKTLPLLWAHRFSGTMSLLVGAGVAPQSAVAVSGAATGSLWIADLAKTAADDVKNGGSLSGAIATIPPVAPFIAEWIRIGESSGSLGKMLDQASARCRQTYETTLTRLLGMLEPALIVGVGVVVLIITMSVLRPMLLLAKSAAG